MITNSPRSFTIVELLIVVSIVGILSGLALMVINPDRLRERARDANRKKDVLVISEALGQYYADNNAYPVGSDLVNTNLPILKAALVDGAEKYLQKLSDDTTTFCYTGSAQSYLLCTYNKALGDDRSGNTGCFLFNYQITYPKAEGEYCVTNPF